MGNLGKYYLKRIFKSLAVMIICIVPAVLSYNFLNIQWAVVIGIIGFFIYYKIEDKIMKKVTYDLLKPNQKKISCYIELSICFMLLILSFFVGLKLYLIILCGILILYVMYINFKKISKGGKNER